MWNSNFCLLSDDQNYKLKNHTDIPMTIKWLNSKDIQDERVTVLFDTVKI